MLFHDHKFERKHLKIVRIHRRAYHYAIRTILSQKLLYFALDQSRSDKIEIFYNILYAIITNNNYIHII